MKKDDPASEAGRALSNLRWNKAPIVDGRHQTSEKHAAALRRIAKEYAGRPGVGAPFAISCFTPGSAKPVKILYYNRPETVRTALERLRATYASVVPSRRVGTSEPPKYRRIEEEEIG